MCQSAPTLARVSSLGMGLPFGCPHLARTSLLGHLTTLACLGHKAVDFAEAGLWTLRATACLVGSPSCSLLCGSTRLLSWEGLLPSTDDPRPQQPPPPLRGRVEEALLGQGGTVSLWDPEDRRGGRKHLRLCPSAWWSSFSR